MINVMTERRQEARNMNTSTMAACVRLRRPTFKFRQIWSDTVVVSADSRLVISPASTAGDVTSLSRPSSLVPEKSSLAGAKAANLACQKVPMSSWLGGCASSKSSERHDSQRSAGLA